MKILLTTLNAKYIHLNLAIRLLYAQNKAHEGLSWAEFTIKEDAQSIASACAEYDVVAFSCYIWNITQTLEVARQLKNIRPDIKILLGGPEVSYEWESVIEQPEVDFIIVGEGEIPFQQFLAQYPAVEEIPNLVSKSENGIRFTPSSSIFPIEQYEEINPYIFDTPQSLATKICYIETSRGCPYKCGFCLASLDNKVRYLPMETIKSNLLYLMNHGKTIKFLDRTFNMKRDFTLEIFRFILAHHQPQNVFQFEITADILHPDIIKFIDEEVPKGLFRFEIGIQTINQKANLNVSRKQNFDKTTQIIKSVEHKIELHLDLIVGLALDYWADIKYSFEEVFKLFAPELQLGFLKFLKGTPIRKDFARHGFVFDPNPPYQIIKSDYLSTDELNQIQQLENALEIYWNKKRTCYTLKYITQNHSIFDFLLGLGIYFEARTPFHKYKLEDVFTIIADFCKAHYADDPYLSYCIALDYYAYAKIKPQPMFSQALDKKDTHTYMLQKGLSPKFRYSILPLPFDAERFLSENLLVEKPSTLIFRYDGRNKAEMQFAPAIPHLQVQ